MAHMAQLKFLYHIIRQVLTPNWFSSTFSDNCSEPLPLTWAKRGKKHSIICMTYLVILQLSCIFTRVAHPKLKNRRKESGEIALLISFNYHSSHNTIQVTEMAKDGVFDCPPRRTARAKEGCRPPVSSGSSRTTSSGSVSALGDWSLERACIIPGEGG